ncbi:MAG: MOSC domain-containing protein [Gammaproteobacteria bacterium]
MIAMELLSVNVARAVTVEWDGKRVTTGIFKKPVEGPVHVAKYNLTGDGQADTKHHGGADKAVYAYSAEHYVHWRRALNKPALSFGELGENLTLAGVNENGLNIGDRVNIGTCLLQVCQPRTPCYKLDITLGVRGMPRRFIDYGATGIYFRVLEEGTLRTGDAIRIVARERHGLSVATLFNAYYSETAESLDVLESALTIPALAGEWHRKIAQRAAEAPKLNRF